MEERNKRPIRDLPRDLGEAIIMRASRGRSSTNAPEIVYRPVDHTAPTAEGNVTDMIAGANQ